MHLQPGQILADKYRIVRMIGHGGMGSVYEGENVRIRRRVAIKTLHAGVSQKPDVLERFEREAQAAGRIGSEHIVEVLDMGDLQDGSRFMVMEFLEGMTLGERIVKQGRIAPRELVPIMAAMLDGLAGAHAAGIIHRDLKPANVFLTRLRNQPDFVKILDFGVSKFNVLNSEEMSMTRTGAVVGTPYYMSPEQAKGSRAIDHRSDLYSAGVILYEAITGQVPFNAQTFNELIFKIALESPPPPEQFVPGLDPNFAVIMRRSMARDPNERFQSAAEMRDALWAWAREWDTYGGNPPPRAGSSPHLGMSSMKTQMLPMVAPAAISPGQTAVIGSSVFQQMSAQQAQAFQPQAPAQPGAQSFPAQQADKPPPLGVDYPSPPIGAGPLPPAPKSNAPLVVGLSVAALCLIGGGYFVYAKTLAGGAPSPVPTASSAAPAKTETTSEPTAKTAEPAQTTTSEPTPSVDALPDASASSGSPSVAVPTPNAPPTATGGVRPPPTSKPTSAAATATSKPTSSSTGSGRSIGSDL
ncbi:MAG: protein kinase [Myxococcales bacterium]|nr:protein kinase [Myxococcales bacterium]